MFTGSVTGIGHIVAANPLGASSACDMPLTIARYLRYVSVVGLTDSSAYDGFRTTVTTMNKASDQYNSGVRAQSPNQTAGLDGGDAVKVEKAMPANDGEHGHHQGSDPVGGIGTISHFDRAGKCRGWHVVASKPLAKYLTCKCSISIAGISVSADRIAGMQEGGKSRVNLNSCTVENTALVRLKFNSRLDQKMAPIARFLVEIPRHNPIASI